MPATASVSVVSDDVPRDIESARALLRGLGRPDVPVAVDTTTFDTLSGAPLCSLNVSGEAVQEEARRRLDALPLPGGRPRVIRAQKRRENQYVAVRIVKSSKPAAGGVTDAESQARSALAAAREELKKSVAAVEKALAGGVRFATALEEQRAERRRVKAELKRGLLAGGVVP